MRSTNEPSEIYKHSAVRLIFTKFALVHPDSPLGEIYKRDLLEVQLKAHRSSQARSGLEETGSPVLRPENSWNNVAHTCNRNVLNCAAVMDNLQSGFIHTEACTWVETYITFCMQKKEFFQYLIFNEGN